MCSYAKIIYPSIYIFIYCYVVENLDTSSTVFRFFSFFFIFGFLFSFPSHLRAVLLVSQSWRNGTKLILLLWEESRTNKYLQLIVPFEWLSVPSLYHGKEFQFYKKNIYLYQQSMMPWIRLFLYRCHSYLIKYRETSATNQLSLPLACLSVAC